MRTAKEMREIAEKDYFTAEEIMPMIEEAAKNGETKILCTYRLKKEAIKELMFYGYSVLYKDDIEGKLAISIQW